MVEKLDVMRKLVKITIRRNWYAALVLMWPGRKCVPNMAPTFWNTSAATAVQWQYSFVLELHIFAIRVTMISKE